MAQGARVESIETIRAFRVALVKFAEAANTALDDADGDLSRTLNWLQSEQLMHWQTQVRQRAELVSRAKEAVRMKKLFKDSSGRPQSAIDEEKALAVAQRRYVEAEQKVVAVKKYANRLQKEILAYKGQVQRFSTTVQSDVPTAVARLDQISDILDRYVNLNPDAGGPSSEQVAAIARAAREIESSMVRPAEEADGGDAMADATAGSTSANGDEPKTDGADGNLTPSAPAGDAGGSSGDSPTADADAGETGDSARTIAVAGKRGDRIRAGTGGGGPSGSAQADGAETEPDSDHPAKGAN